MACVYLDACDIEFCGVLSTFGHHQSTFTISESKLLTHPIDATVHVVIHGTWKPEVRLGAREEEASPAWLAKHAMNISNASHMTLTRA